MDVLEALMQEDVDQDVSREEYLEDQVELLSKCLEDVVKYLQSKNIDADALMDVCDSRDEYEQIVSVYSTVSDS